MMNAVPAFETVADEYDAGRPIHPADVYDALEPLAGRRLLDVGAGTGISTRSLLARGADVVAVDMGPAMLRQARSRTPDLPAVIGDGAALPVRSGTADLVCFAQSWHWIDELTRVAESRRALRPGGRWAAWWSHPHDDDAPWFDEYWTAIERSCHGVHRSQRDADWAATIADPARFDPARQLTISWVRDVSVDDWLTDQVSHSYIAALASRPRAELLHELRSIAGRHFSDGAMSIRYETKLLTATAI